MIQVRFWKVESRYDRKMNRMREPFFRKGVFLLGFIPLFVWDVTLREMRR